MKSMLAIVAIAAVGVSATVATSWNAKPFAEGKLISSSNSKFNENEEVLANEPSLGENDKLTTSSSSQWEKPQGYGSFQHVRSPVANQPQLLSTIELSPILQTYLVPSESHSFENIKQPVTQPVVQPYLQRYVQQAQPIVQPVVNRVVQPVIHRQLQPYMESKLEEGPAAEKIFKPTQFTMSRNQPIVGTDLPSKPLWSENLMAAKPESRDTSAIVGSYGGSYGSSSYGSYGSGL